jgi:hypothetical protein
MAKVVGDDRLDSRVRSGAYGYLMRLGRAPRLGRLLDQAFLADAIQRFGTTLVLFAFVLIFGGWFAPLLAFFARPLSLKKALIIVTALEVVGSLHVGTLSVVASTGHLRSWGEVTPFLVFVAIIAGLVAVDLWRLGARWIPALLGREVAVAPMIAGLTLLLGTLLWVQSGGAATMSPSASGVTGPTYLWLAVLVGVFWLHRRELRPPGATRV